MRSTDRDAEFVGFVQHHRPDLVRMATLLTAGDAASAEDVVQSTLARLYLAWPRVRRADNRLAYARPGRPGGRDAGGRAVLVRPDPAGLVGPGPDADRRGHRADDGWGGDAPNAVGGKLGGLSGAAPPQGRSVERDGRTFRISGGDGYTTVATATLPDEPEGVVRIQFPADAGWDEDAMVAFLGSVHVGETAVQGVG